MTRLLSQLFYDEAGFIVSAELVLVTTIAVLSMVVGLAEIASAANQELEDVASAFGSVNQSYRYAGLVGHTGQNVGSRFGDKIDRCDLQFDIVATAPRGEGRFGDHDRFRN